MEKIQEKYFDKPCCSASHTMCKNINKAINLAHVQNLKASSDFLTAYLLYLFSCTEQITTYGHPCITNCIESLNKIFGYITPTIEQIQLILSGYDKVIPIFKTLVIRNISINPSVISFLIQHLIDRHQVLTPRIYKYNLNSFLILINYLIDIADQQNNIFLEILENIFNVTADFHDDEYLIDKLIYEIVQKILLKKIIPSKTALNNAIRHSTVESIQLLITNGAPADNETLDEACLRADYLLMETFLNYKIVPTETSMGYLLTDSSNYRSIRNLNMKTPKNKKNYTIQDCIKLLIRYGYKITKEDIIHSIEYNIEIPDITNLGIEFDEEIVSACILNDFTKYDDKVEMKLTSKHLAIRCRQGSNLSVIRKMVDSGVVPTIECLQEASTKRQYLQVIKYLVEDCGLNPDLTCVKNYCNNHGNSTLKYLIEKYETPYVAPPGKRELLKNKLL